MSGRTIAAAAAAVLVLLLPGCFSDARADEEFGNFDAWDADALSGSYRYTDAFPRNYTISVVDWRGEVFGDRIAHAILFTAEESNAEYYIESRSELFLFNETGFLLATILDPEDQPAWTLHFPQGVPGDIHGTELLLPWRRAIGYESPHVRWEQTSPFQWISSITGVRLQIDGESNRDVIRTEFSLREEDPMPKSSTRFKLVGHDKATVASTGVIDTLGLGPLEAQAAPWDDFLPPGSGDRGPFLLSMEQAHQAAMEDDAYAAFAGRQEAYLCNAVYFANGSDAFVPIDRSAAWWVMHVCDPSSGERGKITVQYSTIPGQTSLREFSVADRPSMPRAFQPARMISLADAATAYFEATGFDFEKYAFHWVASSRTSAWQVFEGEPQHPPGLAQFRFLGPRDMSAPWPTYDAYSGELVDVLVPAVRP